MSRNSSGTYSTPAGQPVVSGTVISSATFNTLVSDLAAETTDSLSRSGKGGMTAPLRTADGTVAAPAHAFTSETGSGWYRIAAHRLGMAILGVLRLEVNSTGVDVPDALTAGSVSVDTTLGVTGKTTLTGDLEVQGASIAITTGDVTLTQAASDQSILKSAGSLDIGTTDTNSLRLLSNNVARFTLVTGGDLESNGTATLTNLPTPSAASDAATKSFAEGLIALADGKASISWGTNWADATGTMTRLYKLGNLVILSIQATLSAGASTDMLTLPSGYRPAGSYCASVISDNSGTFYRALATGSTGIVFLNPAPTASRTYYGTLVFPTT